MRFYQFLFLHASSRQPHARMQKTKQVLSLMMRMPPPMQLQTRRSQPQMLQQWRALQPRGFIEGLNWNSYC